MLRAALVSDSCVGITAYRSENRVAAAPRSENHVGHDGRSRGWDQREPHVLTRKSAMALLAVAHNGSGQERRWRSMGRRATLRFSLRLLVAATLRRPIRSPSPRSGPGRRGGPTPACRREACWPRRARIRRAGGRGPPVRRAAPASSSPAATRSLWL